MRGNRRLMAAVILSMLALRPAAVFADEAADLGWEKLGDAADLKFARRQPKRTKDMRLFEKTVRAVVAILVVTEGAQGMGSGFIIDPSGLILTNSHVINDPAMTGEKTILVALYDRSRDDGRIIQVDQLKASVVGYDEERDIAVLKINADRALPALKLQTKARIGEPVWAIGSPFGYKDSFSQGIISGLGRFFGNTAMTDIQTTAAINSGNSGGPLINAKGQVVGINHWMASEVGENNGVSFAVPIGKTVAFIDQILRTGTTALGRMQIGYTEGWVESKDYEGFAVIVTTVGAGGPADRAGLKSDDAIIRVGGRALQDVSDFVHALGSSLPGDVLSLEIVRPEGLSTLDVKMEDARAQ